MTNSNPAKTGPNKFQLSNSNDCPFLAMTTQFLEGEGEAEIKSPGDAISTG
jgi:hypothetical protein